MQAAGIGMDIASNSYMSAAVNSAKLAGGTMDHLIKNSNVIDDELRKINDWNENYDNQGRLMKKKGFVTQAILLI